MIRLLFILTLCIPNLLCSAFLQTDPSRLNGNPFIYVYNSPPNLVDKNGKWPFGRYKGEILSRHPSAPEKFALEKSSVATLNELKPGRALVGVVNKRTGKLYLNPVDRRLDPNNFWSGEKWTDFQAKIKGKKVNES